MSLVYHYDWTLSADDYKFDEIIEGFKGIAKKYSFQLEESDGGYKHYQGRLSLIKKRRIGEALKLIKPIFEKIHISVTSNNGLNENFYVLKQDTRIDGPWCDTDVKPLYIPRQIREIKQLYPWQESLIEFSGEWNTRHINVIIDVFGNIGKTTLATFMSLKGMGRSIPFCNDYKDIMRMVMDMPTSRCYLIDLPRAISKDRLFQLYGGIETIKSGYAFDDRYHFKEKFFDCPNIWLFSNVWPDEDLLSRDRWRFWEIGEDKRLGRVKSKAIIEDDL